ncbi:MAG: hypothetical protein CL927_18305 [Deltaproteobacteria bacterium]|nr:hypothetical protein [Deltaproteobacteria bacterium]HCH63781.1 hypothetical protein [Deltaproteobacteria bacterium]
MMTEALRITATLVVATVVGGCGYLSKQEGNAWLDGQYCQHGATEPDAPDCVDHFVDADGDGYGGERSRCLCAPSDVFLVTIDGDCDDSNAAVHPGALEVCDEFLVDDDCDATTANGEVLYYLDRDGDGFGTESSRLLCAPTAEFRALSTGDCDDEDAEISSDAEEICDGRDNDCDPETEEAGLVTVVGGITTEDLQEAIDAAIEGDVLQVCPGVYAPVTVTRPISLLGRDDAGTTIVDAQGVGSALVVAGVDVAVSALTFTGGTGTAMSDGTPVGGGILMLGGGALYGDGIVVTGNAVDGNGAGIHASGPVVLEDSLLYDNLATGDGGGIYTTADALMLTNTNVFYGQADRGAGLFVHDTRVVLDNSRVAGNFGNSGGGAYVAGAATFVSEGGRAGELTSNSATVLGAGLLVNAPGATVVVENVRLADNIALGFGGGAAVIDGALTSVGASWVENSPEACPQANYPDDVFAFGVSGCAGDQADFTCSESGCVGAVASDCSCPL